MKNSNVIILWLFGFSLFGLIGCASFPKKKVPLSNLNLETLNNLNGRYAIKEILSRGTKDTSTTWKAAFNFSTPDLGSYPTIFDEMDNHVFKKEIIIEEGKKYALGLEILNRKKIKINFIEDDSIVKQKRIGYRLKDDGYIYLRNGNFKIRGLPPLFSEINFKRIRLTLNSDNNLLFETSEFGYAGPFLLMVIPASKMKYEKIYQRIN